MSESNLPCPIKRYHIMAQRETRKQIVLEQLYSDILKQARTEEHQSCDSKFYESSFSYNFKDEEDGEIFDLYASRETDQVKSRSHHNYPPLSIKLIPPSPTFRSREYRNHYASFSHEQHSVLIENDIYSGIKAEEENVNENSVPVYSHTEPYSSKTHVQHRKRQVVEAASVILHMAESENMPKEIKQKHRISCDLFTSSDFTDLNQSCILNDGILYCRDCDKEILQGGVRCRIGEDTAFFHRDCFTCSHYNSFLCRTE
ncbi:uncharacterized protein FA14DRAFT_30535 [Meira miltonrushii]|uniref:Uncharacterized protein n=1 Tax=Meira miltonrushii TaxID=1280837 RepID=A0A316V3V1_9BASI|nr:uncharacterized protein FA14DRAFT_30535 [Meira miltonrushii]PWN31211.1 hypothetical protein FA14DRAFT_30535 [Meira miltonrushii]